MSANANDGISPKGGRGKEKERENNTAQEVGAGVVGIGGNVSKHAETDEEWMMRPSVGRKSKLFGGREIPNSQESTEGGMALTLSEGEQTDEDMDAAAELQAQMPQLAKSPTPAGRTVQPANKKRRFSAIPVTPVRPRPRLRETVWGRKEKATMADVAALYAATKEILEQGKAAEAMATAGWKRVEEETTAHKQGIISMFDRITTIQSDFRTTIRREDALEGALQKFGAAIEQNAREAVESTNAMAATVSGAATEIIWLKSRVGALERVTEQAQLEAGAAKAATREVAAMLEKMEAERVKVQKEERRRREAAEERLAGGVHSGMDILAKQVKALETVVFQKEDQLKKGVEAEMRDLMEDHGRVTMLLREALEAAEKRKDEQKQGARPREWAEDDGEDMEEIPRVIRVTPAQALDMTDQVTEAVAATRREQKAQDVAEMAKRLEAKDAEIRRLQQALRAQPIPFAPSLRTTPVPYTTTGSLEDSRHAPNPTPRQLEAAPAEEDAPMAEAPAQRTEDEEEVDETSPEARGDSPVSEADSLEYGAEERKTLIRPALPTRPSNPPTAPRRMRENPPPPIPPRPTVRILKRPVEPKKTEKKEAVSPPAPKTTWAAMAAPKPAQEAFALIGKKGKVAKPNPKQSNKGALQSPLTRHKGSIPVDKRMIVFTRKGTPEAVTLAQRARITTAVNGALYRAAPTETYVRVELAKCSPKGTITMSATMGADAKMLLLFRKQILEAANKVEPSIVDVGTNETWAKVKIMGVPYEMYRSASGMKEIAACLEMENGLVVPFAPRWLRQQKWLEESWEQGRLLFAPVVITVRGQEIAKEIIAKGIRLCGMRLRVEAYVEEGKDAQCDKCAAWGHSEFRCPQLGMLRCGLCGEKHRTSAHVCQVAECGKKGRCKHLQAKCANCGGAHSATWPRCPFAQSARDATRRALGNPQPRTAEEKGKEKEEDETESRRQADFEARMRKIPAAEWTDAPSSQLTNVTTPAASGSGPSMT